MKNLFKVFIPSLLFLLSIFIVGTNLNKPFWGVHDWNGARYGNIARNYFRYGLFETKFGQVENGGIINPADFIYYTHYQPLLPLLISASYKVLGVNEYATRVVPLIASAGFVVVLYFIGLELFSWQAGLFASLLSLATPMVRYYGKNPVHEPLALFFASISFLGALIVKKGNRNGWKLLIIGFVLTALTNWSFAFLLPALTIFLYEKKAKKNIFYLWILAGALAGLHFLHAFILTGSFLGGGLREAFLERTSVDNAVVRFGVIDYLQRIRLWSSTLFTNTLLVSSFIGLVMLLRSKLSFEKKFILSVVVYCVYPVFFANASFIHSYFIYYFTFPLSLLAGYFCFRLIEYRKFLFVIALGVLAAVWMERAGYVKALNLSSGDELAVKLSQAIKAITKPGDKILVSPGEFTVSRMPILSFYSERNILVEENATWDAKVDGTSYTLTKE